MLAYAPPDVAYSDDEQSEAPFHDDYDLDTPGALSLPDAFSPTSPSVHECDFDDPSLTGVQPKSVNASLYLDVARMHAGVSLPDAKALATVSKPPPFKRHKISQVVSPETMPVMPTPYPTSSKLLNFLGNLTALTKLHTDLSLEKGSPVTRQEMAMVCQPPAALPDQAQCYLWAQDKHRLEQANMYNIPSLPPNQEERITQRLAEATNKLYFALLSRNHSGGVVDCARQPAAAAYLAQSYELQELSLVIKVYNALSPPEYHSRICRALHTALQQVEQSWHPDGPPGELSLHGQLLDADFRLFVVPDLLGVRPHEDHLLLKLGLWLRRTPSDLPALESAPPQGEVSAEKRRRGRRNCLSSKVPDKDAQDAQDVQDAQDAQDTNLWRMWDQFDQIDRLDQLGQSGPLDQNNTFGSLIETKDPGEVVDFAWPPRHLSSVTPQGKRKNSAAAGKKKGFDHKVPTGDPKTASLVRPGLW